jgi:hypothetical protein
VVYAPTDPTAGFGDPDPVPNALVYIPNSTVEPFTPGVQCNACGAPVTGDPIVNAITNYDGTFTISNVPVGPHIPVVVQIGTWRRKTVIPMVAACTDTTLSVDQTRLPRNQSEGDIPSIAMVTGALDPVECVLWKMGIDTQEFVTPSTAPGAGRVQMYRAPNGSGGFGENSPTGDAPNMSVLVSSLSTLEQYDLVIFSCVGAEVDQTAANQQNVIQYANEGGRIYGTHYAYVWAFNDAPFSSTAQWATGIGESSAINGSSQINTSFTKGALMANWLQYVNATTTLGTIPMNNVISDFKGVNPPSEAWISNSHILNPSGAGNVTRPIHYSFDTPVDVDAGLQCGRMVYSDFHVDQEDTPSGKFPAGCTSRKLTPQEKVLEFMLYDLGSCIGTQSPIPVVCQPQTCPSLGYQCGPAGDGCGNVIQCGPCPSGETCGGGGQANICGSSTNTK